MKKIRQKLKSAPQVLPQTPRKSATPRRTLVVLATCVALIVGGAWLLLRRGAKGQGPLQAQSDYVDPQLCASCHQDVVATYRKTGMGRSFSRPSNANTVEDYTSRNSLEHKASGFSYTMVQHDGKFFQRRSTTGFDGKEDNVVEEQVDYVIGSGNHARTYLHRTAQGKLAELPVSWYTERSGYWAMSPGYDSAAQEDIRRTITPECLFCHNGFPELDSSAARASYRQAVFPAKLPEGIDCQRCHGPGRAHITAASARKADPQKVRDTIVNPENLPRDRQLEVCLQCHLETSSSHSPNEIRAFDRDLLSYRPGQPLGEYKIYFDRAKDAKDDTFEVAHAAYRLRQSKCFLKSGMTCLTCHDPHDIPRGDAATQTYVNACKTCHEAVKHTTVLPVGSNCISCHMPKRRTEDVVHVVMTDHYIRSYKPLRDLLAPIAEVAEPDPGTPVVPYYPKDVASVPRGELYLAVAQVNDGPGLENVLRLQNLLEKEPPSEPEPYVALGKAYMRRGNPGEAVRWFEAARQEKADDLPATRELVLALSDLHQDDHALQVLQQAVAIYPNDDMLLTNLGNIYLRMGKTPEAQEALNRAVAANPERADAFNLLGLAALQQGDNAAAESAFRSAIRWQPDLAEAQSNLGTLLTGRHDYKEAEFHFRKAIGTTPAYAEAHHGLGLMLLMEGSFPSAEGEMRQAVSLQPSSAQDHSDLADLFAAEGQVDAAEREYRETLRLKPEQMDAQLGLGLMLLRKHQTSEAKDHLAKAAASGDPEIRESAAKALAQAEHP